MGKKDGVVQDTVKGIKGMFRLQIVEDGTTGDEKVVIGDSGWVHNLIVDSGINEYLVKGLQGASGLGSVKAIGLGYSATRTFSGTHTALDAEISTRITAATASTQHSNTGTTQAGTSAIAQFTAAFSSNILAGTYNINEVGLFATTAASNGSAFCLATYASSQVATNQAVNVTYQINFA